jgi:hypothetical protein
MHGPCPSRIRGGGAIISTATIRPRKREGTSSAAGRGELRYMHRARQSGSAAAPICVTGEVVLRKNFRVTGAKGFTGGALRRNCVGGITRCMRSALTGPGGTSGS